MRFAEVSRSALTELGVSLRRRRERRTLVRADHHAAVRAPFFACEPRHGKSLIFSDFLNLFLFDSKNEIAGVVRALQNKGLFQSLAEPNLVAEDGKEASFLAGGEYPYPVVQGQAAAPSI